MTSTNPDPSRTTAREQAPTTGSSSPVYPEEGTTPASPTEETTPAATQVTPAAPAQPVQRTRAASFWVSVVVTALILIALIIFLAQNSHQISVHFLGWSGHISQAVALLIAAVCGALLVAIPASIRVVQLRRGAKKAARSQ
jgi:uncharacterized integral membrane protein